MNAKTNTDTTASDITVSQLVISARAGDQQAYGELYLRFSHLVYSVSLGILKDHHQAEDLVQAVFLHGLSRLSQLQNPGAFRTWIAQIARNQSLNYLSRVRNRSRVSLEEIPAPVGSDGDILDGLLQREVTDWATEALTQLPGACAQSTQLRYQHGLSLQAIADQTGNPLGTVKRQLHTGRGRLQSAAASAGFL